MEINKKNIDYDNIISVIKEQFEEIVNHDVHFYEDYNIVIAKEQLIDKKTSEQLRPNTIFIVVRFSPVTINFGLSVLPITITAISEQNNIDVCQRLLLDYAQVYNLERTDDKKIQQIYESPTVTSNFNIVYSGFRSILYVSGTLVISEHANYFDFYYCDYNTWLGDVTQSESFIINNIDMEKFVNALNISEKGDYILKYDGSGWRLNDYVIVDVAHISLDKQLELLKNNYGLSITIPNTLYNSSAIINIKNVGLIPTITQKFTFNTQQDVQAFFSSNNLTKSHNKFGTITYNFITYNLSDVAILNQCIDCVFTDYNFDKTFPIKIKFANGKEFLTNFRLVNFESDQQIGNLPSVNCTFTM